MIRATYVISGYESSSISVSTDENEMTSLKQGSDIIVLDNEDAVQDLIDSLQELQGQLIQGIL
jgi:hypothetical protein